MSMEDMEKEIENEMMNNAAVKIQASFRGFKTRKQIGSEYGVSRKGKSKENASSGIVDTSAPQPASTDPITCDESRVAEASSECALAERLSPDKEASGEVEDVLGAAIASGGGSSARPPLSCLRSRSYPGSHELEEAEPPVVIDFDEGEEDRLLNPEPEVNLELDPDYINRAATKIQANFRGYKVRKSFKRPPPGKENSGSKSSAKNQKLAHPTQSAQEKSKALATSERLQDNNNEEQQSQQSEKAATKIQASFRSFKERQRFHQQKKAAITIQANIRGYLTRKRLANLRRRSFQRRRSSAKAFQKELEDMRKVNEAATKIQAVFRGYQVRSKILPRSSSMINEHEQIIDE